MNISNDNESQQKGIVFILWPNHDIANTIRLRYPINNGGDLMKSVLASAPIRISAFHFCTPDNIPFFNVIKSVFLFTLANEKHSRVKFHSGEPIELRYQISGYGTFFVTCLFIHSCSFLSFASIKYYDLI